MFKNYHYLFIQHLSLFPTCPVLRGLGDGDALKEQSPHPFLL